MFSKITLLSLIVALQISLISAKDLITPLHPNNLAEVNLSITYDEGGQFFVEKCEAIHGKITFTLEADPTEERKYLVNVSGTATRDLDYTVVGLTDTITFAPGQSVLEFPILVIPDILNELDEDMTFTVSGIPNEVIISSISAFIHDDLLLQINDGQPITVCRGTEIFLSAPGAATYLWAPAGSLDNTTTETVKYTSNSSGTVSVTGTLGTCIITEEVVITIINPGIILTSNTDSICGADLVTFSTLVALPAGNYSWRPAGLFPVQNQAGQSVMISQNTDVIVTYTVQGCTASDTLRIRVAPGVEYDQPFTDTIACKGERISLGDFTNAANYQFVPSSGLDFSDIDHPSYVANKDANYHLIITASDGSCTREYDFNIVVAEGSFDLKSADYVELCAGDSTLVEFTFQPKTSNIVWTPMDSTFRIVSDTSFYAKPAVTTVYTGTFSIGPCIFTQSITVRVDSIPELPISNLPLKPFYCRGEIVNLISPSYDKLKYPDITYDWGQPLGGIEPYTNLNLTVVTQDTFLYIRKTTNRACYQEDSILLNVKVPILQFDLTDTTVCANAPVPVNVTTEFDEIEWSPEEGVSCTDCGSVIITTPTTATYTATIKSDGCPAAASITITIDMPGISLSVHDTTVCPNEPVQVSVLSPATNLSWSPEGGLSCDDCVTTVITTGTEQNYVVSGILDGCPAFGGIAVHISPDVQFSLTAEPPNNVAIGNPITVSVVNPIPGASYRWKINGRDLGVQGSSYEIIVESNNDLIEAILEPGGGNFCEGVSALNYAGIAPYVDVPNAFTPNSDSKNDVFKAIAPVGVTILEMTIVNRWGQKVFSETNSNDGWDGKFNNKDAPSDTYVFVVKYQLEQGGIIESRRGEVTLYR